MTALDDSMIEYAVCGGLAMAVHGAPRATIDIDLLVRAQDADRIEELAATFGSTFRAHPMTFADGAVRIRGVTKIDPHDGETLMLDLLLVTAPTQHVWDSRERLPWSGRMISVVSREGLIALKRFRNSYQDLADIERLS